MLKLAKHYGPQSCDFCGREFDNSSVDDKYRFRTYEDRAQHIWRCPHCGYDNRAGVEIARYTMRVASQRAQKRQSVEGSEVEHCPAREAL